MNFQTRLKSLRKEKNITQKMLSSFLNLSANSICEWEKGRSEPNIGTLIRLSDYFGVSIDYLLGRADDLGTIAISPSPALELTTEEKELVDTFRRMTKETQAITLDTVHSLAGDNERRKSVLNKRA